MGDGGGGYATGSEGGVSRKIPAKNKKVILGLDIISETRYDNITITRR